MATQPRRQAGGGQSPGDGQGAHPGTVVTKSIRTRTKGRREGGVHCGPARAPGRWLRTCPESMAGTTGQAGPWWPGPEAAGANASQGPVPRHLPCTPHTHLSEGQQVLLLLLQVPLALLDELVHRRGALGRRDRSGGCQGGLRQRGQGGSRLQLRCLLLADNWQGGRALESMAGPRARPLALQQGPQAVPAAQSLTSVLASPCTASRSPIYSCSLEHVCAPASRAAISDLSTGPSFPHKIPGCPTP